MGDKTSIEWTATAHVDGSSTPGATWNPVVGCTKVSAGCKHCYAETLHDKRHRAFLRGRVTGPGGWRMPPQYAEPFERVVPRPDRLDVPCHWQASRRVFVNSMSDLFHKEVPDQFLHDVYHTMEQRAPWHQYQILTKRPVRMRLYLDWRYGPDDEHPRGRIPSRHVWHGVSVENRSCLWRLDELRRTRTRIRFVSFEPLLEDLGAVDLRGLQWIIIGAESGGGARACAVEWIRALVAQARALRLPVFVKQLGAVPMMSEAAWAAGPRVLLSAANRNRVPPGWVPLKLQGRKGGNVEEFPIDLQLREMPA